MPNPVLRNFNDTVRTRTQNPPPSAADLQKLYGQPPYTGSAAPDNTYRPGPGGVYPPGPPTASYAGFGGSAGAPTRYMTLDDVVMRTGAMLGVILAIGAVTWALTDGSNVGAPLIIGLLGGLGLGLYMALTRKANAVTSLLYAAFEGMALGAISKVFEQQWPGIVVQALLGTVMVAVGVLIVYKTGAIRVTPRLYRMVFAATLGIVGLMLVNAIAYLFTSDGLGIRSGGALAIIFSLVCIVVAAFNLIIDFDVVEQGIKNGADEKFAWFASFGIVLTLVWLYLEILRLLSYLQRD
jgi:uncharacterized YccA/Bax inhibitor family protein